MSLLANCSLFLKLAQDERELRILLHHAYKNYQQAQANVSKLFQMLEFHSSNTPKGLEIKALFDEASRKRDIAYEVLRRARQELKEFRQAEMM